MAAIQILILITLFQVKHFIVDWVLQTNRIVQEKGDFRKPGGYIHAGQHMVATAMIGLLALPYSVVPVHLTLSSMVLVFGAALYDGVSHYLIDYSKMRHGKKLNLSPSDRRYWALIGLDQLAHNLVYAHIIYLWSK